MLFRKPDYIIDTFICSGWLFHNEPYFLPISRYVANEIIEDMDLYLNRDIDMASLGKYLAVVYIACEFGERKPKKEFLEKVSLCKLPNIQAFLMKKYGNLSGFTSLFSVFEALDFNMDKLERVSLF